MNLKEYTTKPQRLVPGHRTCSGCPIPIIVRNVLASTDKPIVAGAATGCLQVTTTIYPDSSWAVPYIHNAFENVAATISGIERAFKALKKKGKVKKEIKFIAFGGDGASYDIGLQSLSGALERGHDFLFVCYDNQAYMNTGNQRSSATPYGAAASTAPAGKVHPGKEEFRKDLTKIVAAHNIPYVAQSAVHNFADLTAKAQKALSIKGPSFLNVFSPCTLLWKYPPNLTIQISKLAAETKFWPLYEIEDGVYKLNYRPVKHVPITEFIRLQGRFKHLFKEENKHIIDEIQKHINSEWSKLLKLCKEV